MTRSPAEMAEEFAKMAWSKRTWLNTFSSGRDKRPDHQLEIERKNLEVLEQAVSEYREKAERAA